MATDPTSTDFTKPASSPSFADQPRAAGEFAGDGSPSAARARSRVADGLESAAQSMHAGGARLADATRGAGEALASSAQYLRDNDIRSMTDDAMEVVKKNPGVALLGAAALGFLLGRLVARG